jgi:hypothetical protein
MSLSYQEIKGSKVKTKYYSESENKVFTKTELLKIIEWDWNYTPEESLNYLLLNHDLPCDLEELKRIRFYRDDQIHPFDCEFATGNSCHCWCGEKYHGLHGKDVKVIQL